MPPETQTLKRPPVEPQGTRGPSGPGRGAPGWGGPGSPGGGATPARPPVNPARIGVWLLVGAVGILFGAFTIAYLSRRHAADWSVGPIPLMLWINTAVLLMSSVAMEWTRASARWDSLDEVKTALASTTALGIAFLVGQVIAWRQLVAAGIYMATNPHSAFFYLFTGTHALHLVGGVGGLIYALWKVRQSADAETAATIVGPVATYWHFVDGLWLYLFILLFWL
ncbi:MAG: cytochrome c oxidase subunit 3 [Armatimonadota bacterium]